MIALVLLTLVVTTILWVLVVRHIAWWFVSDRRRLFAAWVFWTVFAIWSCFDRSGALPLWVATFEVVIFGGSAILSFVQWRKYGPHTPVEKPTNWLRWFV